MNMKNSTLIPLMLLCALAFSIPAYPCTSVILSGKVTSDGRPLMWKNRDTGAKENLTRHFPAVDGHYSYVGIVDASSSSTSIWIGTNSEGFCIMNTLSYNIKDIEDESKSNNNGRLMTMALQRCRTVQDFQNFLDTLPRPLNVGTNYGVIDAQGNGAYFEVNFTDYYKFDVNDPAVAPDGYLVRSNFSFNGRPIEEGRGQIRYQEAERQVRMALKKKDATPDFILRNMARDYCNPALGTDCRSRSYTGEWAIDQDIIVRRRTTCSVVIQGVRPGEDPQLTTMWTIVGYPGTTVAMPVWEVGGEEGLPAMLKMDEEGHSPLAHHGYLLKEKVYSWDMDKVEENKTRYFRWSMLSNKEGTGYIQQTLAVEDEVLAPYRKALKRWRKGGKVDLEELGSLNKAADDRLTRFIREVE